MSRSRSAATASTRPSKEPGRPSRRGAPGALACAGADADRARAAGARLVAEGAEALVSFGLCGGLDPALRPGTLLLPTAVRDTAGTAFEVDVGLRAAAAAALGGSDVSLAEGIVLGLDRQVTAAADKRALFAQTAAQAVDMESLGVAAAAREAGVPVLVLRAVADPAERDLPRAAIDATGPEGRIRLFKVLSTMYLRPWEGPAMIRLAYEARLAVDTLERTAAVIAALSAEG